VSPDLAARLISLGTDAFAVADDAAEEQARQQRSYESLERRARSSTTISAFLAEYDACMRLAEWLALEHGLRFGASPHLGFKIVLQVFMPEVDQQATRDLVASRHKAKKNGLEPDAPAVAHLRHVHSALRQRVFPV
jgi:hypothetical protein